jgi:excisionase family DNA binding protein
MNTTTTPAIDEPYLTRRESAAYLKVSVKLLEKLASAGTGPRYFRAGGKLARYRKGDLDAWMQAQTFGGGSDVPAPRKGTK